MRAVPRPPVALGDDAVRPPTADVAVWAFLAAASLNAVIGVFILARFVASGATAGSPLVVAVLVLVAFVYAGALVVLSRRFRDGVGWARTALFMVSFLSLLAANGPGLFVVLLLLAANVLAFLRPVTAWLRARNGLRPA